MLAEAGLKVSANRWYEWEKIGTEKDSRRRKAQLKEKKAKGSTSKQRESSYYPPWPDELYIVESVLGIRHGWLISGTGGPYVSRQNQRATDSDPLFATISRLYKNLTEEQKHAIEISLKAFVGTNKRDVD